MAQSLQDIRRRIRSVQNMERVTAAMKMVSASKLRRSQERAQAARPYAQKMRDVLANVSGNVEDFSHPLLDHRTVRTSAILLVTADRGLAGAYNANIIRAGEAFLRGRPNASLVAVGRKGRDHFRKRGYPILAEFVAIGDDATWDLARRIGDEVMRIYRQGEADEISLGYAQFLNAIQSRPTVTPLLPLSQGGGNASRGRPYIFEPDAAAVLTRLLPHYVYTLVFRALLEAKASEHGARMAAMDNASKNAREVIDHLTLVRNRVRQAAITKEIAEIVGGANALTG
ncbi:MAG TPA: ATP synthase F1 subunit gamma [Bacillota bacterium]|nr:ATP synthase F1 subunit gamma [Bacillota bacterium]